MSIVVRSEFWNNPIVQHLYNIIQSSSVKMRSSDNITCDLLFPFAHSLAVFFIDINTIDENIFQICEKMAKSFRSLLIVVKVDEKNIKKYTDFVSRLTEKVHTILYLEPENFDYNAAQMIWTIVTNTATVQRNLNAMVEERRRIIMNPSEGARIVINKLIKDNELKEKIFNVLSQRNSTLRSTLLQCIPEFFTKNFILKDDENSGSEETESHLE